MFIEPYNEAIHGSDKMLINKTLAFSSLVLLGMLILFLSILMSLANLLLEVSNLPVTEHDLETVRLTLIDVIYLIVLNGLFVFLIGLFNIYVRKYVIEPTVFEISLVHSIFIAILTPI